MKKKLDDLTKMKIIYSGELIIIAIAILVVGILEIVHVLSIGEVFRNIFNWVTIFGASFMIFEFIWMLVSEKKRKKSSLFDRLTLLPLAIYLIVIDIIMFMNYGTLGQDWYNLYIPIALIYVAVIYIAQGIYHWKYPLPSLLDELEQERINKITYEVIEKLEDGSVKAKHVESKKIYLFTKESKIKEEPKELFCLDQYKDAEFIEFKEENKEIK